MGFLPHIPRTGAVEGTHVSCAADYQPGIERIECIIRILLATVFPQRLLAVGIFLRVLVFTR